MDQIISVPIPLHLILITRPYLINFINARYPTNLLWVMLCGSVILCLLVLTFPLRYPPSPAVAPEWLLMILKDHLQLPQPVSPAKELNTFPFSVSRDVESYNRGITE